MDYRNRGMALGLMAVACFGLTLPMTRLLVGYVNPLFAGFGRMALAGGVAIITLMVTKRSFPQRSDFFLLALVALGVIFGFPLLSSFAMVTLEASNAGVIVAFLPLVTALFAAILFGERPTMLFWFCAGLGSLAVALFSVTKSEGFQALTIADCGLLAGVLLAGAGYAAGGGLTRSMKGWEVICWALALSFPVSAPLALLYFPPAPWEIPWEGYGAFLYVSLISQLFGFFAWYHAMSLGGIARVGQTQLLQPFITIGAAVVMLGEKISGETILFCAVVVATVAIGKREPVERIKPSDTY